MADSAGSYRIAGIGIRVIGSHCRDGMLGGFRSEAPGWDHTLTLEFTDALDAPAGEPVYGDPGVRIYRDGSAQTKYVGSVEAGPETAHFRICRRGALTHVQFCASVTGSVAPDRIVLHAMDLPHLLTIHDGFVLHASYIEHEGRAILFTAPSETGKSTQAALWCDHMGAELVNGDRAAVRILDGQAFACGIPFSGSSPVRRNVTLPLGAIVYLSQAKENAISRLRGVRAFRAVWEGCTVNVWDREDLEKATKTVSEVVSRVPVYHLACTPDVRAAELLKQTMEAEA